MHLNYNGRQAARGSLVPIESEMECKTHEGHVEEGAKMEEDMVKGMGYHCFDSIFFFFCFKLLFGRYEN